MALMTKTVNAFLDELASSSPAPGGGSVAALSGAIGAALAGMVAQLTVGKKKYAEAEPLMKEVIGQAETIRKKLSLLVDEDTKAFEAVMQAFALPKETDADKQKRADAIETATKSATQIPFNAMQLAQEAIALSGTVAEKGNANALSDAGVSALMLAAACRGAYYNVRINLAGLKDERFILDMKLGASGILNDVESKAQAVRELVEGRL